MNIYYNHTSNTWPFLGLSSLPPKDLELYCNLLMRDAHYIYWAEAVLHKLVCLFSIEVQ